MQDNWSSTALGRSDRDHYPEKVNLSYPDYYNNVTSSKEKARIATEWIVEHNYPYKTRLILETGPGIVREYYFTNKTHALMFTLAHGK